MTAYDHLADAANDVVKAARTFKTINTRYTNALLKARGGNCCMSRMVAVNAANELYFAARKAARLALRNQ
jgi:hypothetical protein